MDAMTKELGPAGKIIEQGWTQCCQARNSNGESVYFNHAKAVCWCIYGAVSKAYLGNDEERTMVFQKLEEVIGTRMFAKWNDDPTRTKEEVLEVFRKAGV